MKKRSVLPFILAFTIMLSACGGKGETAPDPVPENETTSETASESTVSQTDPRINEDFYAGKPDDLTDLRAVMDYLEEKLGVEWITDADGQHNGVWMTEDGHRVDLSLFSEGADLAAFSISSAAEDGTQDTYAVDVFAPFFCKDEDAETLKGSMDQGEIRVGSAVLEASSTPFETSFYMYFGDYYESSVLEYAEGENVQAQPSSSEQEDNIRSDYTSYNNAGAFTGLAVNIDGHDYLFPMQVKELEANGWKIGGYTEDWTDGSYLPYYEKVNSGESTGQQFVRSGVTTWGEAEDRISFEAFNPGDEPCDFSELWIYDISSDCQGETIPFNILGISGKNTSDEEYARAVDEGTFFVHPENSYMDSVEVSFSFWGDSGNRDFWLKMNHEDILEILENRAEQ